MRTFREEIMIKNFIVFGISALIILSVFLITKNISKSHSPNEFNPVLNNNQKWNIGYYQGGDYIDYRHYFLAVLRGLQDNGWIDKDFDLDLFDDADSMKTIWRDLCETSSSKYLNFVEDAFWDSNWNDSLRLDVRSNAIMYLKAKKLDLVIAMGTWAGKDLANNEHHVPVTVFSSSDAVKAGIIKSETKALYNHVFAQVDKDYYIRQIRLFHDIFNFKKIGTVFENSEDGRIYANYYDLKKVSEERGFEILECYANDVNITDEESKENVLKCFKKLAPKIDALWIGAHNGTQPKFMPEILEPMFEYKVPTWAEAGLGQVRRGVLISVSRKDYKTIGTWSAEKIIKILKGASPASLQEPSEISLKIAINIKTAELIGFDPPENILKIADVIYHTIEKGKENE